MAYNGSGTFNRLYTWTDDRDLGVKIRADRMDAEMDGMATGLSTAITKDGQTTITANLPMAGFRHTGVGNASARNHYAAAGQVQDNALQWLGTDGGAADAYTFTMTPTLTAYATGQRFAGIIGTGNDNTGACTVNIDGIGAKNVKLADGTDPAANDIVGDEVSEFLYDGTNMVLLNPKTILAAVTLAEERLLGRITGGNVAGLTKAQVLTFLAALGQQTIWLLPGTLSPTTTNGCAAAATEELATNDVQVSFLAFDDSTQEHACAQIVMPNNWDGGTFVVQFFWKCGVTTGNVIWGIQAVGCGDDDALDAAFGAPVEITDGAGGAADDVMITSETSAMTPAGSPAAGELMMFKVYRKAADGSDTLVGDAELVGVRIHYTTDALTDS